MEIKPEDKIDFEKRNEQMFEKLLKHFKIKKDDKVLEPIEEKKEDE